MGKVAFVVRTLNRSIYSPLARTWIQGVSLPARLSHYAGHVQSHRKQRSLQNDEKIRHISLAELRTAAQFVQRLLGRLNQAGTCRRTYRQCHDEVSRGTSEAGEGPKFVEVHFKGRLLRTEIDQPEESPAFL